MPDQKHLMNRSLPEIWREMKGKTEGIKEEGDGDIKDQQWTGGVVGIQPTSIFYSIQQKDDKTKTTDAFFA